MQPETPQPSFTQNTTPTNSYPTPEPPTPPRAKGSRKRLVIIIIAIVLLIAVGIGAFILLQPKDKETKESAAKPQFTPAKVTFGSSASQVSYAGNKVYDACNLVPQNVIEKAFDQYKEVAVLSSGKLLDDPIMMEHGYIDRTIPGVLGKDGTPREPSMEISETGVNSTVRAKSFMSIADSYCFFGQGRTFGTKFAEVYVMQAPVPIPTKLSAYLDTLKQQGRMVIESQGVQVFIETVQEGDTQHIAVFRKGATIVFLASKKYEVLEAASDGIVAALAKEPTGPMTASYPKPYEDLTNPCDLFSASDFERLLGRPTSPVTLEAIALTETAMGTTERECTRYEVERIRQGEISSSRLTLMQSRSEESAKKQLESMKTKDGVSAVPLSNLGDEAYTLASTFENAIVFRVDKQIAKVVTSGEVKDVNIDAFKTRTLPIAQVVLTNLKR